MENPTFEESLISCSITFAPQLKDNAGSLSLVKLPGLQFV